MRNKASSLAAYTTAHFCVDFSCFIMLFACFAAGTTDVQRGAGFLLYNVVAFGLQAPIGALCDRYPRFPAGVLGCTLVAVGLLFFPLPWAALIFCALGNALFHVEGGIDSLVHASGKMGRSGIFVSTGAMGVALGTMLGKSGGVSIALPLILLAGSAILILLLRMRDGALHTSFPTGSNSFVKAWPIALFLLFIAIMIRSYGGCIIPMSWRADYVLLPSLGACLGKALGGVLADKLGARNVGAVSLLCSIPLLCFGWQSPVLGFIGILLFNMNMPITLCAVAGRLQNHPGLAFGFTTLALLMGSILPFFYLLPQSYAFIVLPVLCAVSAVFMILTISNKGVKHHAAE